MKAVLKIVADCKQDMAAKGIFQWTETYPNKDIITTDICNGDLWELVYDSEILGVICFNVVQSLEYQFINWEGESQDAIGNPSIGYKSGTAGKGIC
jgi:hypothetical protein